jgi:hypothetical protein
VTREQRAAEILRLCHASGSTLIAEGYTTFDKIWDRISELVGRSTFNHELADPESLAEEVRTGHVPSVQERTVGKLRRLAGPDKPIVVVETAGKSPEQVAEEVARKIGEQGDAS